jgi:hypothetical protein
MRKLPRFTDALIQKYHNTPCVRNALPRIFRGYLGTVRCPIFGFHDPRKR